MNSQVFHVSINETRSWDGPGTLGGFPDMSAENQAARPFSTHVYSVLIAVPEDVLFL